jgi:hemerythrin-like domain-containing protein
VVFARMFADEFHHFKEEHLLLGRLAQKRHVAGRTARGSQAAA